MSLDVIELLGLVVSAIVMLYTLLSRFSVSDELERAKALQEAARLFDELESQGHDFGADKGIVFSNDALVGYKKSLRNLHFHTTFGVGEISLMALVSFVLALGIYLMSVTVETGIGAVLWYALALFALIGVPAVWIFVRRYVINRESREISDEEKARLLGRSIEG